MPEVWKKLVSVTGRKTEVWGTGTLDGAVVHIVVIPGNPGSAGTLFTHTCRTPSHASSTGARLQLPSAHKAATPVLPLRSESRPAVWHPGYYKTFLETLSSSFQGQAYITTVSSLGFHTLANAHDFEMPTYTLHEQTEHKAHYLRQECLAAHDLPVVVCGHSIGLHMAMKALEMIENGEAASGAVDPTPEHGRLQVRNKPCTPAAACGR